jgi:hypothetical protein
MEVASGNDVTGLCRVLLDKLVLVRTVQSIAGQVSACADCAVVT